MFYEVVSVTVDAVASTWTFQSNTYKIGGERRYPCMDCTGDPIGVYDRTKLKVDDRLKAYDTKYKYWMLAVKKRDGWKCKINNQDCRGRLEAHHILGWKSHPELRYQLNNGITLCLAHHPRKRSEEAKLSPYFQKLVIKTQPL